MQTEHRNVNICTQKSIWVDFGIEAQCVFVLVNWSSLCLFLFQSKFSLFVRSEFVCCKQLDYSSCQASLRLSIRLQRRLIGRQGWWLVAVLAYRLHRRLGQRLFGGLFRWLCRGLQPNEFVQMRTAFSFKLASDSIETRRSFRFTALISHVTYTKYWVNKHENNTNTRTHSYDNDHSAEHDESVSIKMHKINLSQEHLGLGNTQMERSQIVTTKRLKWKQIVWLKDSKKCKASVADSK